MPRLLNLFSGNTLSGGLDYFDYELAVARNILVPWLQQRMTLQGIAVGDFGCHQGGILEGLRQFGGVQSGIGFDLDEASIRQSRFQVDERFHLEVGDVTQLDAERHRFDLILLRDVLEHIPDYAAVLEKARQCLKPQGRIFISFPPWFSPFGGHQQEATNWVRAIPFLHYLPTKSYLSLIETADTAYMSAESSRQDIESVCATRLTLARAESAFRQAGLTVQARELFLLRPEFRIRYGLPMLSGGPLGRVPVLREVLTMGAYYLLGY